MDYKERELTEIADALKSIDKSLKEILELSRENKATPLSDDCSRCLCAACENRSTCKLKSDEILTDIKASPCNGCRPGERFRPVEAERCPKYIKGDSNAISLQSLEHGVCIR